MKRLSGGCVYTVSTPGFYKYTTHGNIKILKTYRSVSIAGPATE